MRVHRATIFFNIPLMRRDLTALDIEDTVVHELLHVALNTSAERPVRLMAQALVHARHDVGAVEEAA